MWGAILNIIGSVASNYLSKLATKSMDKGSSDSSGSGDSTGSGIASLLGGGGDSSAPRQVVSQSQPNINVPQLMGFQQQDSTGNKIADLLKKQRGF